MRASIPIAADSVDSSDQNILIPATLPQAPGDVAMNEITGKVVTVRSAPPNGSGILVVD